MSRIPRDPLPESTLALMRDPYRFISRRCHELGSDIFQTRLLLHPTICGTGRDFAELFYDPERFRRAGAPPDRIQKTLLGRGGIQSLDEEAHRKRRQIFLDLTDADRVAELRDVTARCWDLYLLRWSTMDQVVLRDELPELLTRAVCEWAAVPLPEREVARRTRDLTAMFRHAGSVGPAYWWARLARQRSNRWARRIIDRVRTGALDPAPHTVLDRLAWHRGPRGRLLSVESAAVDLLNILRPTVAVSVYMLFAAVALHRYPAWRTPIAVSDDAAAERFVQEVRRFYPFFPAVPARVRRSFEWRGYRFPRGRRVLLDLYGTNHDPRLWTDPETFNPDRFRDLDPDPFAFVPQGGGDRQYSHRCPGERIVIELTKQAVLFLATRMQYEVPEQDLTIDLTRLPALPASGFIISRIKPVP